MKRIVLAIIIILAVLTFFVYKNFSLIKNSVLYLYFKVPAAKTIYEQNSHNNFPKTAIPIPEKNGFLIAVYKDAHKLNLFEDNKIIREYDVNIRRDRADRETWEDGQTPEGIFKIETMDIVENGWARWMRLDTTEKAREVYLRQHGQEGEELLNVFEKEYGRVDGDAQIRKFNSLNKGKEMLRGIGIHGGGFFLYHEWTEGCVGLSNEDVIELFDILRKSDNGGIGTLIIIQD